MSQHLHPAKAKPKRARKPARAKDRDIENRAADLKTTDNGSDRYASYEGGSLLIEKFDRLNTKHVGCCCMCIIPFILAMVITIITLIGSESILDTT